MTTQPKPTRNDGPCSWEDVITDLYRRGEGRMVAACAKRDREGFLKYGVRLQPHNGRNTIQDAIEESMDLVVYLKTRLLELPNFHSQEAMTLSRLYHQAIGIMCELRELVEPATVAGSARDMKWNDWGPDFPVQMTSPYYLDRKHQDTGTQVPMPFSPHPVPRADKLVQDNPPEAPVAFIPTVWANTQVTTDEPVLGHPGAFQGVSVEVASTLPTVFIPEGLSEPVKEDLVKWAENMNRSLEAERRKFNTGDSDVNGS